MQRVRVSSSGGARRGAGIRAASTATRGIALPGQQAHEADAVFARGLLLSQLRLALGIVFGFAIVVFALGTVISIVPELDLIIVAGVPLSWLLHAYAFYPVIAVFALVYLRAARRNERRYQALQERE